MIIGYSDVKRKQRKCIITAFWDSLSARFKFIGLLCGILMTFACLKFYAVVFSRIFEDTRSYYFKDTTGRQVSFLIRERLLPLSNSHGGYIFAFHQSMPTKEYHMTQKHQSAHLARKVTPPKVRNSTGRKRYYLDNSIVEHDPQIDENAAPDSYKWFERQRVKPVCSEEKPVKYLTYLRIHRAGSQSLSNLLFRVGDDNNRYFALPNKTSLQFYWPLRFHHSHIDKSLLLNGPEFLINVARTQISRLTSYMPRHTYYITMLRDPVTHFQSIFEYLDLGFSMQKVGQSKDVFSEFANNPLKWMRIIVNRTRGYEPAFDLIKNPQLFDLGYESKEYKTKIELDFIMHDLEDKLDFVLIAEHFDESLVLLQRKMCWNLKDMVYLKQNVRTKRRPITTKNKWDIELWNKEDVSLYRRFNETLWNMLKGQDEQFWRDVRMLKQMNVQLEHDCLQGNEGQQASSYERQYTLKKEPRGDVKWMCERINLNEREYIVLLKNKQRTLIENDSRDRIDARFETSKVNTHFLYAKNTSETNQALTNNNNASPTNEPTIGENDSQDSLTGGGTVRQELPTFSETDDQSEKYENSKEGGEIIL